MLLQQLQQQQQQAGHAAAATLQPAHQAPQQAHLSVPQSQQPMHEQQVLPWSELNKLRSRLDLKRLPQQLVVGSK